MGFVREVLLAGGSDVTDPAVPCNQILMLAIQYDDDRSLPRKDRGRSK